MFKNIIFIALVLCGVVNFAHAQENTVTVKGKVLTEKQEPLAYMTVALLKYDSSVVNGGITNDEGVFEITPIEPGKYILRVSGIGISTINKPDINLTGSSSVYTVDDIIVSTNSQVLNEVKIVGTRPLMEMGIDKKTFNVEQDLTSQGGSASDVLQNVPSVTVDIDGNVSLRGKGNVTILIDGKPATLLGGDDATALQSLPASSISQVEVITNPSAKYDATGMTGIINIITKRDKKFGTNGSIMLGAGTRDKYNGNLSLNTKNEKWNVFLNSSYRQNFRYQRNTITRDNKNTDASTYSYEDLLRIFNGFFNTIGAEYTIDTHNSFTLTQNINKMRWGRKGPSEFTSYINDNDVLFRQERETDFGGGPFSLSTSLDYKHKFRKKERELTSNATFARSWMDRHQMYYTEIFGPNDNMLSNFIQDAPGQTNNTSFNGQIDYASPQFTKNGKLETGVKTQMFWLQSINTPTIDSGSGPVVDSILINGYDYLQHTYAAYASWGDQVGKFRYKGGLRMEYMYYEGTATQVGGKEYFNDFLNLFPSAFVSYELPKMQSMYLSYTRRTHRPRFWHLLPYVDLSNPQDTSVGNPDLVPEFIHNVEMSYNKLYEQGHSFIASTYYQYTQNLISDYRVIYGDGTSFTQRRNLNAGVTYGLELTSQVQLINRVWDATFNANFFNNEILGSNVDPTLDNSGFGWFAKLNTSIRLPKDFSIQFNGNYDGPKVVPQGLRDEAYWIDVALRKNFWDGKANLVLNVSDIFNTRKYNTDFDFGNIYQSNYNDRETRIGNINFSYRFGSNENKGFGSRRRNGKNNKSATEPKEAKERDNIQDGGDDGGGF